MSVLFLSFCLSFLPFLCKEGEVLDIVAPILGESPVVVEAGAFDGADTIKLAHRWPKGQILTFEPYPALYKKCVNALAQKKNVRLFPQALSSTSGKMIFYLSDVNGHPYASSSLHPPAAHKEKVPWVTFKKEEVVQVVQLDEVLAKAKIPHVDFFWLDVQGHELSLLQGYTGLEQTKALWCEVSFIELYEGQVLFQELRDYLHAWGFVAVGADFKCELVNGKPERVGNSSCGNMLFVREDLVESLLHFRTTLNRKT